MSDRRDDIQQHGSRQGKALAVVEEPPSPPDETSSQQEPKPKSEGVTTWEGEGGSLNNGPVDPGRQPGGS